MKKKNNSINFVADVGCNHQGNLKLAMKMIDILVDFCNIKFVKFQKRNPIELLGIKGYSMPHPVPSNSFGETYGLHREKLEFNIKQHKKLQLYCKKKKIEYMCSAWDLTSLKQLIGLKVKHINNDDGILIFGSKKLSGGIHQTFGDHRIAMAIGVAGLVSEDSITIKNAEVASISYKNFWSHLKIISEQ